LFYFEKYNLIKSNGAEEACWAHNLLRFYTQQLFPEYLSALIRDYIEINNNFVEQSHENTSSFIQGDKKHGRHIIEKLNY